MPGPRPVHGWRSLQIIEARVCIGHLKHHGRTSRQAQAYTCRDHDMIGLDPLTAAAAVSTLTPLEFSVDELLIDHNASRQPRDESRPAGAV